jgi:hypothetical protein
MCKGPDNPLPLQLMLQSTIDITQQVLANLERCKIFIPDHESGTRKELIEVEQTANVLKEQLAEIAKALSSEQEQEPMRKPVITFLK